MPKDFRASQVRTTQIIASGSDANKPSILIVSASDAAGYDGSAMESTTLLGKVGPDVFMFVSGSDVKDSTNIRGVTVFGGDVVFSGTLYDGSGNTLAGGGAPAAAKYVVMEANGSLSNETVLTAGNGIRVVNAGGTVTLTNTNMNLGWISGSNIIYTTGSFGVGAANPRGELQVGDGTGSETLIIDSDGTKSGSILFVQDTGNPHAAIVLEADDNFVLVQSASNKDIVFKSTTAGAEKLPLVIDGSRNQVLILSGGAQTSTDEANSDDVAFFVSGARGDRSSATTRGTSLFGGDVVVSGALAVNPGGGAMTTTVSNTHAEVIRVDGSGITFNEAGDNRVDFRVESDNKINAIKVDASADQVLILSGGAQTSLHAGSFTDTNFYVSGAIGSRGSADKGTSVFGGDLVSSGALMAELGLSGSLTQLADGTSYIKAGSNVTITSASNGAITIASSGGGGGGSGASVGWFGRSAGQIDTTGSLGITGTLAVAQAIQHVGETGNKIDFVAGQILFLSGGAQTSVNATAMGDTNFFVSGAVGVRGTSVKGAATFGGDVIVSGTSYHLGGITGSLTTLTDGSSYIKSGDNITISTASNGQITINASTGGSGTSVGWIARSAGQIDTTGSLGVSGTLAIAQAIQHVGETGNKIDFTTGRVLILSGGHQTSPNQGSANDTNFFVSGSSGTRGTTVKGTAVFGGDVVASGSLLAVAGITGSLQNLSNGNSYLVAGNNMTVVTGADGSVTIASTGGGTSNAPNVGWIGPAAAVITTTGSVYVGTANTTNPDITFGSDGATVFNEQSNSVDFRIESNTNTHAVFVDGSTDQVLILTSSGGADGTNSDDVSFYVSGAIGDAKSEYRGTSVFGGDLVVSGNVHVAEYIYHEADSDTYIRFQPDDINIQVGGVDYIQLTEDGSQDKVIINNAGADLDFVVETVGEDEALLVDASANSVTINKGETAFTTSIRNVTDEVILVDATGMVVNEDGHADIDFRVETDGKAHALFVDSGRNKISILSGSGVNGGNGSDVSFFVSGGIGARGGETGGAAVFAGDAIASGSVTAFFGLSGSLTNLSDGRSYLVAGSNVTITSGSNDQIVISSTGGGGGSSTGGVGWFGPSANAITTTGSVYIGTPMASSPDIYLGSDGAATFNEQGASVDFRVESNTKTNAIFVDGSTDQVLILSGGAQDT